MLSPLIDGFYFVQILGLLSKILDKPMMPHAVFAGVYVRVDPLILSRVWAALALIHWNEFCVKNSPAKYVQS